MHSLIISCAWAGRTATRRCSRARLASLPDWSAATIHAALNELATQLNSGLGRIAQPVRVAVTGTAVSPPIDATLALLGRERTLARLDAVLGKLPPGSA